MSPHESLPSKPPLYRMRLGVNAIHPGFKKPQCHLCVVSTASGTATAPDSGALSNHHFCSRSRVHGILLYRCIRKAHPVLPLLRNDPRILLRLSSLSAQRHRNLHARPFPPEGTGVPPNMRQHHGYRSLVSKTRLP